ncbi:virulence-associated E family protein [Nostoc sp.]|uniref:virulence-associated E family protein n=1 Tax=Nostoc sp. TaxID=1180 RepID=UPI002FF69EBF
MKYSNDSSVNQIKSTGFKAHAGNLNISDSDDNDYQDNSGSLNEILGMLNSVDILDTLAGHYPDISHGDHKAVGDIYKAKQAIKGAINKAGSNAGYVWWEVFKAVYGGIWTNQCSMRSKVQMNEWSGELLLEGKPTTPEALLDTLENALGMMMKLTREQFDRKFSVWMEGKTFNPVRRELEAIKWQLTKTWVFPVDAKKGHLETKDLELMPEWNQLANIIFGTDDPLSQKMLEKWLIASVARAMSPGCQADNSLVLKGEQGIGKSSFFRVLGGEHFLDLDNSTDGTETKRQLDKSWIVEMGEMEGITRKKEVEELKAFLTKTKDTFRGLWERRPTDHNRHCVFGGTCNSDEVLRDNTGNRRFWIIPCGDRDINIDFLKVNRDAILASAYHQWELGVIWWADKEMTEASEDRNKDYQETNEFAHMTGYLITALERDAQTEDKKAALRDPGHVFYDGIAVNASDLMAEGLLIPTERHKSNRNDRKVAQALQELGYNKSRLRVNGRQVWYWVKPGVTNPHMVTIQDIGTARKG